MGYSTIEEILEEYKKDWGGRWQELLFHELFLMHGAQVRGVHPPEQDHRYFIMRRWCLERIIEATGDKNDSSKT